MGFDLPTATDLQAAAAELGLDLSAETIQEYRALLGPFGDGFAVLDAMPDDLPPVRYPREGGRRPTAEENPHNAWYWKTSLKGAPAGKLAGRTVVLKDNVMLAGVPMMNGTSILEGYVPEVDATIVTRILDAGGEIVGKAHCEGMCLSGGSHTNATGLVHNPLRRGYSAGGSSSGSAVLVAAGEVDIAIGADQGGSIRMPASFCGVVGLKPTWGLVPYTGILPMDPTIDHVGPITRSVYDNALLLEVVAGPDGFDPRQRGAEAERYTEGLDRGVRGMRIGVLREGFGTPVSEPEVDRAVRAAAEVLAALGAEVREVSVPMHLAAGALNGPIAMEAVTQTMLGTDGFGTGRRDLYVVSAGEHFRRWRERADELPETVKLAALIGTYLRRRYGTRYYGKAINLTRRLTAAYDAALTKLDLLMLPTTPMKATPIPGPDATREEIIRRAFEPTFNTMPFNHSHHPALSVPCGKVEGLPVGMMLVGRRLEEATVYRAGYAYEQAG